MLFSSMAGQLAILAMLDWGVAHKRENNTKTDKCLVDFIKYNFHTAG